MTIRYQVRGRVLMDMVRDIKEGLLVMSPYFQRKLVWRDIHKVDFIKTILLGYPFPEIFIARGDIDLTEMKAISSIVDGQQRMNSIVEFTQDNFQVDGKFFSELSGSNKENFLKYEIAVIDLDVDRKDPQVVEIFKRLNRTFYALSQIEKLSTEHASSYLMQVSKMLCGEYISIEEEEENVLFFKNVDPSLAKRDPNITEEFIDWANGKNLTNYDFFIEKIFTGYEISRQVHLMYTLNLITTYIYGIYNRNEQVVPHLEDYADDLENKNEIVDKINEISRYILDLGLSDEKFWFSKSNSFSLFNALLKQNLDEIDLSKLSKNLNDFAANPPADYSLAAKEAVNNKKERSLRHEHILGIISKSLKSES